MINTIFIKLSLLLAVIFSIGCSDMKLQKYADYDGSVLDPHINMTAWEYLHTREDLFSEFILAIEHAQMQDYYQQNESLYTFIALTNSALNTYRSEKFPAATTITECPAEDVKKLLQYHIVDGFYSGYGELDVEPIFVLTLLRGQEGLMTMLTRKNPWMGDAGKIVINDTGSNDNSPLRQATSSNIMPTNGVVHVFESYCYYKQ